jgi:predicted nucleotidyltransferase
MVGSPQTRRLEAKRLADRRARALAGARAAIEALRQLGVTAELIGSLADQRFDPTSDIDLLVTTCPRRLKYAIESIVEDCLPGFSFDVLYLDELPAARAARYREALHGLGS